MPAANYHSQTVFIDYDIRGGHVSNDFVAPPFSGPVAGIAIDSASHMMCTTTGSTYSVQMYDLTTKKQRSSCKLQTRAEKGKRAARSQPIRSTTFS